MEKYLRGNEGQKYLICFACAIVHVLNGEDPEPVIDGHHKAMYGLGDHKITTVYNHHFLPVISKMHQDLEFDELTTCAEWRIPEGAIRQV